MPDEIRVTVDPNAVEAAVDAVRARDRRTRRYFASAIGTILIGGAVAVTFLVAVVLHQTQSLREQGRVIATLVRQGAGQRADIQRVLCLVASDQTVILAGLRHLAHEFGVVIPPIPGEVSRCQTETDDVIAGTEGPDRLRGTPRQDFIAGFDGNDILFGRKSADTLIAGNGKDLLRGGRGNDTLRAIEDDAVRDVLRGGYGNDTCTIHAGDKAFCEHITKVG